MAAELEFCLLGPMVVRSGGVVIPVQRGRQRIALAAMLLNAGQAVSVDQLAETLWGQRPPPSARVVVRNCGCGCGISSVSRGSPESARSHPGT